MFTFYFQIGLSPLDRNSKYSSHETLHETFLVNTVVRLVNTLMWYFAWVALGKLEWVMIWAVTWDFQQCGMCDQQRLRPACAVWLEPLHVAWIFNDCLAFDWTPFGFSKLKRRLYRLVWIYTCQNTTLLEITCHGSFVPVGVYSWTELIMTVFHNSYFIV